MNFGVYFIALATILKVATADSIDANKVVPLPQPSPSTSAEKAAIKFKPQLSITDGCVSFPAVNSNGETSSGLKEGIEASNGYTNAPLGSQVFGRAAWYNEKYAILYAWYFPKGSGMNSQRGVMIGQVRWCGSTIQNWRCRRSWAFRLLLRIGNTKHKCRPLLVKKGPPYLITTDTTSAFQDLIMWEQLPNAAKMALNTTDFGVAKVPVSDVNFDKKLEKAWPF